MREIWKYEFDDGLEKEITLPIGAVVRHVDSQRKYGDISDEVFMWIELDADWEVESEGVEDRRFYLIATGDRIPADMKYVGTAKVNKGQEFWHVYESNFTKRTTW